MVLDCKWKAVWVTAYLLEGRVATNDAAFLVAELVDSASLAFPPVEVLHDYFADVVLSLTKV